MKRTTIYILFVPLLVSCFKENVNEIPVVEEITISQTPIIVNDIIQLSTSSSDSDSLSIEWNCNNGEIISGQGTNSIQWKAPVSEGTCTCEVQVNDKNVYIQKEVDIRVSGLIMEDFSQLSTSWLTDNCFFSLANNSVIIRPRSSSDYEFTSELNKSLAPPYKIFMQVGYSDEKKVGTADKYGVLLDFYNVGADTVIKKLWIRIYPKSDLKNWRISAYVDKGNTNAWEEIDSLAVGMSEYVKTGENEMNNFEIEVSSDLNLKVTLNEHLLYNAAIMNNYSAPAPLLKLQKIGIRSTAGNVLLDNIFLTGHTDIEETDVF